MKAIQVELSDELCLHAKAAARLGITVNEFVALALGRYLKVMDMLRAAAGGVETQ
jgi:phosphotransferase system HPr-like phosphotransfer protein